MLVLKAIMDAITKRTEAVTGMQQGETSSLRLPGLEWKKIDVRFLKVQEFDEKNEEWDGWSFSFKSSIRAQDMQAYELLSQAELETSEIHEICLSPAEMISGEVHSLLRQ